MAYQQLLNVTQREPMFTQRGLRVTEKILLWNGWHYVLLRLIWFKCFNCLSCNIVLCHLHKINHQKYIKEIQNKVTIVRIQSPCQLSARLGKLEKWDGGRCGDLTFSPLKGKQPGFWADRTASSRRQTRLASLWANGVRVSSAMLFHGHEERCPHTGHTPVLKGWMTWTSHAVSY